MSKVNAHKLLNRTPSETSIAYGVPVAKSTGLIDQSWLPFVGMVVMYGNSTAPAGWLSCDGSAVSRTTYSALFAIIGTTFGAGNGSTTFNLPDFRGVFPKGAGTTNRAAGVDANGNAYAGTLGTYLQDKFQGHKFQSTYRLQSLNVAAGVTQPITHNLLTNSTNYAETPVTDGTNGNPRTGMTTEPQSLGINFIIKY